MVVDSSDCQKLSRYIHPVPERPCPRCRSRGCRRRSAPPPSEGARAYARWVLILQRLELSEEVRDLCDVREADILADLLVALPHRQHGRVLVGLRDGLSALPLEDLEERA